EHAVNLVAVRSKQIGARAGVRQGLDRAMRRHPGGDRDGAKAFPFECLEHLGTPGRTQMGGEKSAIADEDPQSRGPGHHGTKSPDPANVIMAGRCAKASRERLRHVQICYAAVLRPWPADERSS